MNKLILFYGTPDKIVVPTYGKGEEKHDYGQIGRASCRERV